MRNLLFAPILVPLFTAALALLFLRQRSLQRAVSLGGAWAHLAISLALLRRASGGTILTVQAGSWPAPFGISLACDILSALMLVITGLMAVSILFYSLASMDRARERYGYYPLYHLLLMGVSGSFLTADVFNLYVWFEVMLISSFALLALGGEAAQIEGSIKYVVLNLAASAIFLAAAGLTYGLTGTLNMAHLAIRAREFSQEPLFSVLAVLFMVAFGLKAAVFPLFFWLPASYHTCPVPVSAIFAGLLTKVGVYVLIRFFTLIFITDHGFTHGMLLWISLLTMVTGVLGALAQHEFRRILSFHIVSQIGYMVLGLALYTPLALAGSVFYIIHHILVKANLFLISGLVRRVGGAFELASLGGLHRHRPWLGFLFLIPALSLAGLPPLSGFFAKLALVQASFVKGLYGVAAIALLVSLLTLLSMLKIWNEVFWKPAPAPLRPAIVSPLMVGPTMALASLTLVIGFFPTALFSLCERAAQQLLHPAGYIQAVMGVSP